MIRGRLSIVVVMMWLVISGWLLVKTPLAQTLSVTATVEPSQEWKKALTEHTLITLETPSVQLNQPVKITVLSKGILEQNLADQKVNVVIYFNNLPYLQTSLTGNKDGYAGLAFVPTRYGKYDIRAENITYSLPIQLSPLEFTVQELSVFTFMNNIVNILPKFHISL